jgi:hypothetical protein
VRYALVLEDLSIRSDDHDFPSRSALRSRGAAAFDLETAVQRRDACEDKLDIARWREIATTKQ